MFSSSLFNNRMLSVQDRRVIRNLRVVFAAVALLVATFGAALAWRSWVAEKEHEQLYLASLANVTANSLDEYFFRYERMLGDLAEQLAKKDILADPVRAHRLIGEAVKANPDFRRIGLVRPDGHFLMSSDVPLGGVVPKVTSSPSFPVAVEELRQGRGLSISWPTKSIIDGSWIMNLRAPVRSADGMLTYVIGAALPVSVQQRFWNGLSLPQGSSIGLLRDDMFLISRYPAPTTMSYEEAYGKPRDGDLTRHLRKHEYPQSGVIEGFNSVAKANYLWAFQRMGRYPVTVFVTSSIDNAFNKWWRQMQLALGLATLLLVGGYAVYRWSLNRQLAWSRERGEREEQIRHVALHDALTGLPNRACARDRLEQALAHGHRAGSKVGLIFVDLDNFKGINDTLGHSVGDLLLQAVARRLSICLRETDTLSRQGGDEFLIILPDLQHGASAAQVAEEVLNQLTQPFMIEGQELFTSLSMGVAIYPDDGSDVETLLRNADTAMYKAKDDGKNTYRFFTETMNTTAEERRLLRNWLRQGLEQQRFVLHYQPQVTLPEGRIFGVEALLRLEHPEGGLVVPNRFIPEAEDSGLIVPIGRWVLSEACRQVAEWRREFGLDLGLAVNISAAQFRRGDLVGDVRSALNASGLPAGALELELTESVLIENTEHVLSVMGRLDVMGVRLAIDDFGTGYSSLAYLKRFSVDRLKIDRSFVRDLSRDADDATIVRAVIQIARGLNLKILAEGVENEATASFLLAEGCTEVQGYLFGKPVGAEECAARLRAQASLATCSG